MAKRTVPVSERAVLQRINRKFRAKDGPPAREIKATRGARAKVELGDFYILNTRHNSIDEHHVDPEEVARELGVLADWEFVLGEN